MQKRYGVVEFSKLTGICRATLHRMQQAGDLPGSHGKYNRNTFYTYSDFANKFVVARMKKAGNHLSEELKDSILDEVMTGNVVNHNKKSLLDEEDEKLAKSLAGKQDIGKSNLNEKIVKPVEAKQDAPKLQLVNKPNIARNLVSAITYFELEQLPEGVLKEIIPPVEGLDYLGRSTWIITIKSLVAQGTFKVADITTLIQYCQTADQLEAYKKDTTYFVDVMGKINPLLSEIKTCKATMRGLAKDLHLTPDSRKHIKEPEELELDSNTKGWMEVVK